MVCVRSLSSQTTGFCAQERDGGLGTLDNLYPLGGGVACPAHTPALEASMNWVDRGPPILSHCLHRCGPLPVQQQTAFLGPKEGSSLQTALAYWNLLPPDKRSSILFPSDKFAVK